MRDIRSVEEFDPPGTSNGERPASSEYTVAPSDHTSLAIEPGVSSSSTSGADHGIERPTESSSLATAIEAAMPKSESTGCPYAVSRMLDGLMSRCSTPARCAVSTALPIFTAMRSTSATEMRSRR